jgi:glucan phosphoethanolaminetransferase (alkaline phosphatase superfamily)
VFIYYDLHMKLPAAFAKIKFHISQTTLAKLCFWALLAIQLTPNLLYVFSSENHVTAILESLLPALVGIGLITSLFARLWFSALILSLLALPAVFESWYVINFGKTSDAHLLEIILESDIAETKAYLSGLWLPITLSTIFTVTICVLAIITLRNSGLKWSWQAKHHALWQSRSNVFLFSIAGLMLLNAGLLIPQPPSEIPPTEYDDLLQDSIADTLSTYASSWPTGLPVRVLSVWRDEATLHHARSRLKDFRFNAVPHKSTTDQERPLIVLVIGETSRPDRWQLYGYERETTPHLANMDNLIPFKNAITPWAWTRMSVPIMLSRKPPQLRSPVFNERSFISAFNEAGFKSYWLSNQNVLGLHESPTSIYAHEAKIVRFFNPASYKEAGTNDDILLSPLANIAKVEANSTGTLVVLHTLGSHFNYNHRYPESFQKFIPDRPKMGVLSLHDKQQKIALDNAYDNSILFTDHVLNEAITILKNSGRPAALIYVSDHGENLFDTGCKLSGHGQETERDFRVPMLFWWSPEFAQQHPEKIMAATKNASKPVSTESIFHSILDLATITMPDSDESRSIFSENYSTKSRWVYAGGGMDFDKAQKDATCQKLHK